MGAVPFIINSTFLTNQETNSITRSNLRIVLNLHIIINSCIYAFYERWI